MNAHLDTVDSLRIQTYELQDSIHVIAIVTTDPRIDYLNAMVCNILSFMDDWRIDLLDEEDESYTNKPEGQF